MDGQTYGQTDILRRHSSRYAYASRGKHECMLHLRLHFLRDNAKTRTSNFRKVVRQHTEGVVGSIIWILLEIYLYKAVK